MHALLTLLASRPLLLLPSCVAAQVNQGELEGLSDPANCDDGEFAPGVSFGRALTLGAFRRASEEAHHAHSDGHRTSGARDKATALQLALALGFPQRESYDAGLGAHGYAISLISLGVDVALLAGLHEGLSLGARLGVRERGWDHYSRAPAIASAIDALGVASYEVRSAVGVNFNAQVAVGVGAAMVAGESAGAPHLGPRAHVSAAISLDPEPAWTLGLRAHYDWYTVTDIDAYGSDLDMGGVGLALFTEFRL